MQLKTVLQISKGFSTIITTQDSVFAESSASNQPRY
jgi:hypothetical protein